MKNANKYGCMRCECGSYNLCQHVSYVGCDDSYGWLVTIECEDCGRVYPVARVKDVESCSDILEKD